MKKYLFIIFIVLKAILFYADDSAILENFNKAKYLYDNKSIDMALDKYLEILNEGYDNFEINYNIGCSYFKLEQYGLARFYFERALFYKPFNSDLFHNLSVLYSKILDTPLSGEQIVMNKRIIYFFPTSIVIIFLFLFIISMIIFLLLTYKTKINKKIFLILFFISFVFTFFFSTIFFIQYNNFNKKIFIIKSKESNVYLSPNESETILTPISEGTRGIIIEDTSNYIRVKLSNGMSGWINKKDIISNLSQ